ncbi:hypothetical protein JCM8097_004046 [Rhodosporidiobolus ruineniae]
MDPATLSAGITSSTALSLASSVRCLSSSPPSFLSGLDRLLAASDRSLPRGSVVELQGLPGAGQSSLLLHLAATSLLPLTAYVPFPDLRGGPGVAQVPVGGKESTVAFIDCSARPFPTLRLALLVRSLLVERVRAFRAPQGLGAPKAEDVDALVEEAMARLHVFRPKTTLQLAVTVQDLPRWAFERAQEGGEDEPEVGLVLVDGMSEFAWADQWAHEQASPSSSSSSAIPPLRRLLSALSQLRRTLSPLIFLSQWVFRPLSTLAHTSEENLPFYAHHYAPPYWPSISSPPPPPSTDADANPLEPIWVGPPGTSEKWESFPLALHITVHPAPRPIFPRGTPLSTVLSKRFGESGPSSGGGSAGRRGGRKREERTEGIRCVVRAPGGVELGSWEVAVGEGEVET